uniref:(northern house mosquito) hypothetical protein n=1 Tax=Culex pipiens TaxID=7175 RepID=A0A8D8CQK3_CULPI
MLCSLHWRSISSRSSFGTDFFRATFAFFAFGSSQTSSSSSTSPSSGSLSAFKISNPKSSSSPSSSAPIGSSSRKWQLNSLDAHDAASSSSSSPSPAGGTVFRNSSFVWHCSLNCWKPSSVTTHSKQTTALGSSVALISSSISLSRSCRAPLWSSKMDTFEALDFTKQRRQKDASRTGLLMFKFSRLEWLISETFAEQDSTLDQM